MYYKASIDIGSNSILLLVARIKNDKLDYIEDHSVVVGLGKSIDETFVFSTESMDKAYNTLINFKKITDGYQINSNNVLVTATEASRVVRNSERFFLKIKKEIGFDIKMITSEGEAYYAALGAGMKCKQEQFTLIDMGGASTELTIFDNVNKKILKSTSLPIGSIRMIGKNNEHTNIPKIENALEPYFSSLKSIKDTNIIGIAGTITSIFCFYFELKEYNAEIINNKILSIQMIKEIQESLELMDHISFTKKHSYLSERFETMKSGINIILTLSAYMNIQQITCSVYGLRHGVINFNDINKEYLCE
jgi:exopolyphosphatase / guanosine-5'-triphosphate,3'-diphosphate pyrophosphatase